MRKTEPPVMKFKSNKQQNRNHQVEVLHLFRCSTHTQPHPPSPLHHSYTSSSLPCFSVLSLSLEKLVTCGVIRFYNWSFTSHGFMEVESWTTTGHWACLQKVYRLWKDLFASYTNYPNFIIENHRSIWSNLATENRFSPPAVRPALTFLGVPQVIFIEEGLKLKK